MSYTTHSLLIVFIFISCGYSTHRNSGNENELKKITLPFSSSDLPAFAKGSDGYFKFDNSFQLDSFGTPSRIFGLIPMSDSFLYILVEQKYNEDGAIEPSLVIFSYIHGVRTDSILLNLTIEWEASYTKRFRIDERGIICVKTVSVGYDLEMTQKSEILIKDSVEECFRLTPNGMFSKCAKQSPVLKPSSDSLNAQIWKGQYEIATTGISWSDNSLVSLRYFVSINEDSSLILSIGANSTSDYNCEGAYEYWVVGDTLNTWGTCDPELKSNFKMLKKNSKFYIKSERFADSNWQLLTKTK